MKTSKCPIRGSSDFSTVTRPLFSRTVTSVNPFTLTLWQRQWLNSGSRSRKCFSLAAWMNFRWNSLYQLRVLKLFQIWTWTCYNAIFLLLGENQPDLDSFKTQATKFGLLPKSTSKCTFALLVLSALEDGQVLPPCIIFPVNSLNLVDFVAFYTNLFFRVPLTNTKTVLRWSLILCTLSRRPTWLWRLKVFGSGLTRFGSATSQCPMHWLSTV